MANRTRTRRATRQKRETIWSTLLIDGDDVPTAAVVTGNVADANDWSNNSNSFARGGTLERVRGNITLSAVGVSTNAASRVWMGLWMVNDDETATDPSLVADYNENDLLWSGVVAMGQINLTSVGAWQSPTVQVPIDVKARRRMTTQSILLFSYRATGTNNFVFLSCVLRALIKKL